VSERGDGGISWDDMRDRERDDRNTDQHGRDPADPPYEEREEAHAASRLFTYGCEVRPSHRVPREALHVRPEPEQLRRLIEDRVRPGVEHAVGDLLVGRRA